jgi:hypothetical protein
MLSFEYTKQNKDKKVIAVIDCDGDLIFNCKDRDNACIVLDRNTMECYEEPYLNIDKMIMQGVEKVFYEGESVTLHFGNKDKINA